ncbi:MAG: 5-formyltetrahydrofolate cyclo-ligase [Clostridiales Family XIII bacterium]|jgi:5-formyltetrahydrofolate cyclo-ligase|nr:5-formyltetrahydrofolate cyclo-ligase [Clostridiales Family XIII bacterium]
MDNAIEKRKIRNRLRQELQEMDGHTIEESNKQILQTILSAPLFKKANTLCIYIATAIEIPTLPLVRHALDEGKRVSAPVILGPSQMEAHYITSEDDLTPGPFGILEPKKTSLFCPPGEIELVIVPCLSCDRTGIRIGHGGGYYDRYLKQIRRNRIGKSQAMFLTVCRENLLSEQLPATKFDVRMNYFVTEQGLFSVLPL